MIVLDCELRDLARTQKWTPLATGKAKRKNTRSRGAAAQHHYRHRMHASRIAHPGAQGGEGWEMWEMQLLARPGMPECMRNAECHAARSGREGSQRLRSGHDAAALGLRACETPRAALGRWAGLRLWPCGPVGDVTQSDKTARVIGGCPVRGTCLPRKARRACLARTAPSIARTLELLRQARRAQTWRAAAAPPP